MLRRFLHGWVRQLVFLLRLAGLAMVLLFALFVLLTLYYRVSPPSVSMLMVYRTVFNRIPAKPTIFIPLESMGPATRRAFVKLEDRGFFEHRGVSLGALRDAFAINQKHGRIVAGGSTITMQLVKNLFLWPDRTWVRKALEVVLALFVEMFWSKDRILEIYLNVIEFGPGVYGLEAASRYHYKKSYRELTLNQIYRLAAIITNPLRYDVRTMVNSPSQMARLRFLGGN